MTADAPGSAASACDPEWQAFLAQLGELRARADRITAMRRARIVRLAQQWLGWGESYFLLAHNAMVGYDRGRPWRNTDGSLLDYAALHRLRRLERDLFAAHRIVDAWYTRSWHALAARPQDAAPRVDSTGRRRP